MKTITKITFKEDGKKHSVTQTENGFDVKELRLGKNIPVDHYTFQEFLQLFEDDQITIDGFAETESHHVKEKIQNLIHTTEINALKAKIINLTDENMKLTDENDELKIEITNLKEKIEEDKELIAEAKKTATEEEEV